MPPRRRTKKATSTPRTASKRKTTSIAGITSPTQGDQIVALAQQHIGDKYVFGAPVAKDNANWKGPWDCAEFVSWLVFQVTGRLYGCDRDFGDPSTADAFTGYWKRDGENL